MVLKVEILLPGAGKSKKDMRMGCPLWLLSSGRGSGGASIIS